jgi:hypothetical protein
MPKGDHNLERPGAAVAIVLGASEFDGGFRGHVNYLNSAESFISYLKSDIGLNLHRQQIISFFDSELDASTMLRRIRDFLRETTSASDATAKTRFVIIYYVGHGSHDPYNGGLFMPIKKTDSEFASKTSITANDLWSLIRIFENELIFYVILDCCFAAKFVREAQSDAPSDLMKLESERMPSRGTAFLGAAAAEDVAINAGNHYTIFTEGLLHALSSGVENGRETLSLDEVFQLTCSYIRTTFKEQAVIPQIHSPAAPDGPVAPIRFFPNPLAPRKGTRSAVASDSISEFCRRVFHVLAERLDPPPNWADPHAFRYPGFGRYYAFADVGHDLNAGWEDDPVLFSQIHITESRRANLYDVELALIWHREGDRDLHGNKGIAQRLERYVQNLQKTTAEMPTVNGTIRVRVGIEGDLEVAISRRLRQLDETAVALAVQIFVSLWEAILPKLIAEIELG